MAILTHNRCSWCVEVGLVQARELHARGSLAAHRQIDASLIRGASQSEPFECPRGPFTRPAPLAGRSRKTEDRGDRLSWRGKGLHGRDEPPDRRRARHVAVHHQQRFEMYAPAVRSPNSVPVPPDATGRHRPSASGRREKLGCLGKADPRLTEQRGFVRIGHECKVLVMTCHGRHDNLTADASAR